MTLNDRTMAIDLSAKLHGRPTDITAAPSSDTTDTTSAKDEAYQAMEPDLQAACDDASDPNHDVAMRVWKAETAWLEIQRRKGQ
jgi:hypothetical protein